ncbi:metallophosphoesterase [Alteribacter populi]|uniref:metallophosphoesterase n=1 Tax=Alteribacter populi TaxID=2011011 RepID=UPI000BBB0432|nr:metallophosphoesterase [Alteribacter populi]
MLFFLLVGLVVFTVWDNNRIKVVVQDITLNQLTETDTEFTILQITDLHEKEFGQNQQRLINEINSIEYDAIVFTGDMLDSTGSTNYAPFYTLIDGIDNKEHALFVPGNSDPLTYQLHSDDTFSKSDFINGMEERGVHLLESIYSVNTGSATTHFVYFEYSTLNVRQSLNHIEGNRHSNHPAYQDNLNYQEELLAKMDALDSLEDSDIIIALNHYPVVDDRIEKLKGNPNYKFREFDLILAGHYHGGQFRIPFLGAPFVPEPYYERYGLFPPQDRVKGLWEYQGTKQYVSTGLGSSDALPFMKFRLFNTPEINVLTIKGER